MPALARAATVNRDIPGGRAAGIYTQNSRFIVAGTRGGKKSSRERGAHEKKCVPTSFSLICLRARVQAPRRSARPLQQRKAKGPRENEGAIVTGPSRARVRLRPGETAPYFSIWAYLRRDVRAKRRRVSGPDYWAAIAADIRASVNFCNYPPAAVRPARTWATDLVYGERRLFVHWRGEN